MAKDLFSVPIFFILFRESLEAGIIVSVLLSLVEQIVTGDGSSTASGATSSIFQSKDHQSGSDDLLFNSEDDAIKTKKQLLKKLRLQILAGSAAGLFIALAIGATFIAIYYTQVKNLWSAAEEIWEGVFSLIAAIMIFFMSLGMLKMDRAKAKWRYKLKLAFEKRSTADPNSRRQGVREKYLLFFLPFVTILREGLEAIVFVGGVALGESGSSIPIAAIVGLICGTAVSLGIYFSSRRINISVFLVTSTCVLLLIGAGLMAKTVGYFQTYKYNKGVGGDVSETGDGPGSYDPIGNVWHLPYGNPENKTTGGGWSIFNAILGWNNTATQGTILAYVFYWLALIVVLVWMKFNEGRFTIFGRESKTGRLRRERREEASLHQSLPRGDTKLPESPSSEEDSKSFRHA